MAVESVSSADALKYVGTKTSSQSSGLSTDTKTFLKLLVAQMQYQNPLEPESDTQFVSQLAQMTSLQQVEGITSSIESSQAYGMIGKYVDAEVLDSKTGVKSSYNGLVDSVVVQSGVPYVVVGSDAIPVSYITRVYSQSAADATTTTTP